MCLPLSSLVIYLTLYFTLLIEIEKETKNLVLDLRAKASGKVEAFI